MSTLREYLEGGVEDVRSLEDRVAMLEQLMAIKNTNGGTGVKDLKKKIVELQRIVLEHDQEVDQLKVADSKFAKDIGSNLGKIASMQIVIEAIKKRLDKMQENDDTDDKTFMEQLKTIKEEIKKINESQLEQKNQIEQNAENVQENKKRIDDAVKELSEKLTSLEANLVDNQKKNDEKIKEIMAQLGKISENLSQSKKQYDEIKTSLEKEIKDRQQANTQLSGKVNALESMSTQFGTKIADIDKTIKDLKDSISQNTHADVLKWMKTMAEIGYSQKNLDENMPKFKKIELLNSLSNTLSNNLGSSALKYSQIIPRIRWDMVRELVEEICSGKLELGNFSIILYVSESAHHGPVDITIDGDKFKIVSSSVTATYSLSKAAGVTINWLLFKKLNDKWYYVWIEDATVKMTEIKGYNPLDFLWLFYFSGQTYGEMYLLTLMIRELRDEISEEFSNIVKGEPTGVTGALSIIATADFAQSVPKKKSLLLHLPDQEFGITCPDNLPGMPLKINQWFDLVNLYEGIGWVAEHPDVYVYNPDFSNSDQGFKFKNSVVTGSVDIEEKGQKKQYTAKFWYAASSVNGIDVNNARVYASNVNGEENKPERLRFELASDKDFVRLKLDGRFHIEIEDWKPLAYESHGIFFKISGLSVRFTMAATQKGTIFSSDDMPYVLESQFTTGWAGTHYGEIEKMHPITVPGKPYWAPSTMRSSASNYRFRWKTREVDRGVMISVDNGQSAFAGVGHFHVKDDRGGNGWAEMFCGVGDDQGHGYRQIITVDVTMGPTNEKRAHTVGGHSMWISTRKSAQFEVKPLQFDTERKAPKPTLVKATIPISVIDNPIGYKTVETSMIELAAIRQDIERIYELITSMQDILVDMDKRLVFLENWTTSLMSSMQKRPLGVLGEVLQVISGAVGMFLPLVGIAGQVLGSTITGLDRLIEGDYVGGATDVSLAIILGGYGTRKYVQRRTKFYKNNKLPVAVKAISHMGTSESKVSTSTYLRHHQIVANVHTVSANYNGIVLSWFRQADSGDWVQECWWKGGVVSAVSAHLVDGRLDKVTTYKSTTPINTWLTSFALGYYSDRSEKNRNLIPQHFMTNFIKCVPYKTESKPSACLDNSSYKWIEYFSTNLDKFEELDSKYDELF